MGWGRRGADSIVNAGECVGVIDNLALMDYFDWDMYVCLYVYIPTYLDVCL